MQECPQPPPGPTVACRASPDGRPHRPQSKSGHRSRRSGKPTGSVCRSSPLPSCVLQLAPLSPAQAATTTRGRPQLRPQDWIRSQTPGSPPVRRSQTSAAATLRAVEQCRSSMVGSPGHQLADPDHQQWSPHNAQICAAGAERGIDAATAPNGGSARGYQELPQRRQSRPRPSRQAAGPYVYASLALGVVARFCRRPGGRPSMRSAWRHDGVVTARPQGYRPGTHLGRCEGRASPRTCRACVHLVSVGNREAACNDRPPVPPLPHRAKTGRERAS